MALSLDLFESLEQETDIVSWINSALETGDVTQSPAELAGLDEQITQLLASLDIACEDSSSQLERIIEAVSRSVPRVAYDLHFMKDTAMTLQTSVTKVLEQAKDAVPDTTSVALDHLRHLATIKTRMEAAREALREAESWGSLESEVTSLLAERSYAKAAERLSEASRNMVVFQNTPEYESRRALMVNLQNQLEAALSSALVAAINLQDVAVCRSYFSIFSQIQREAEFRNYYNASRRAGIVNVWRDAALSDCKSSADPSSPSSQSFTDFLATFYNSFLSILQVEVSSLPSIFPDPVPTLSAFISSTLSSLQPSFAERLSSFSDYYEELALEHLITAFRTTEVFAGNVEKLFQKIARSISDDDFTPEVSQPTEVKSLARRRSKRLSISWQSSDRGRSSPPPKRLPVDLAEWSQELFQPFLSFQIDYGTQESNLLEYSLRQIMTKNTSEKVQERRLKERAVTVVSTAEESLSRCDAFTYGYGSTGLVQALDNFFKSFIEGWADDIRLETRNADSRSHDVASGDELSDLDYTAQDWSDFQLLLHLLSSTRVVFELISTFETKLCSRLSQTAARFRPSRSETVTTGPVGGGIQLLEQSPLNSADLHMLLSSVEVDATIRDPPLPSSRHPVSLTHELFKPVLIETRRAVFTFANSCQLSLQRTILSPLRKHLASYASSPLWSESGGSRSRQTSSDLQIPTFSLSPSESIQRVAEGLLNLPRLFEIYADDDALAFSLHTLPHIDVEALKSLSSQTPLESPHLTHMRRTSLSVLPKPAPTDPETVSSAWLASLGHGLLIHFTTDILPGIPALSKAGTAQLTSDIEYLENIVHAINVDFPELKQWKEALELSDEDGRRRLSEEAKVDHVLGIIARLRGWE